MFFFREARVKWYHRATDSVHVFEMFIGTSFLDLAYGFQRSGLLVSLNYRSQRSCGKVMFSQASVIMFTGGKGVW